MSQPDNWALLRLARSENEIFSHIGCGMRCDYDIISSPSNKES